MKEQFVETDKGLLVRAPAKLNLYLLVGPVRPDGYHEIETVMCKIDLYDELLIEPIGGGDIELICRGRYDVPAGADNLVYKACKVLFETAGRSCGVRITVDKNIPPGGGLAGGSSDAAATVLGLCRLMGLDWGREKLLEISACLGSDVGFFTGGHIALCTGRGEKVQKIKKNFPFRALLVLPGVTVSTKRIYDNYKYDKAEYSRLKKAVAAFVGQNSIDLAENMCANMLEKVCFEQYKNLAGLKARIEAVTGRCFVLSGSGSAMYLLSQSSGDELERYQLMLSEHIGCESLIVNNNTW